MTVKYGFAPNSINLSERADGKIDSISSLMHHMAQINIFLSKKEKDKDYELFFRGHANKEWKSEPSIYRDNLIEKEHLICRDIISNTPDEFLPLNNYFQKLVKMQHYGIPTRLLDVTANPLIALYFACNDQNNTDKDGEIIVYKIPKSEIKYYDSDTVSILSNLSKMKDNFSIENLNKSDLDEFCRSRQISLLLHEIRQEKNGFLSQINPNDLSKVICVKPLLDNQRLIRQDGAFLIFGINENKSKPATISENHILSGDTKRLVIDCKSKNRIREDLGILGIHHAKLFPEIDKIASHIKAGYLS